MIEENAKIQFFHFFFGYLFCGLLFTTCTLNANTLDDLGYNLLLESLNNNQSLGTNISVTQVEAGEDYFPDILNPEFSGKNFTNLNQDQNFDVSNHATSVGILLYGNESSMSPAISTIDIIGSNDFLSNELDFINFPLSNPNVGNSRVINHSWVGGNIYLSNEQDEIFDTTNLLKHLDWLIANDDVIHVVGASNNINTNVPLLSSAFNVISVGKSNAIHDYETSILDDVYIQQRPLIHIVVPENYTSRSTAITSSAISTLIDLGNQNHIWSTGSRNNRNGDTIYNTQRVEVLKSVLMAGASRLTFNSLNNDNIRDYRGSTVNQTNNGLDYRYGAGQLDIYSSYLILDSGEKSSLEDGGSSNIGFSGFDYDPAFGGSFGSNNIGTYDLGFIAKDGFLQASLSWNLRVDGPGIGQFSPFNTNSILRNLSLTLVDINSGIEEEIQLSDSLIDNTQNLWVELESEHHYQLKVKSLNSNFRIDYGIAWIFNEFSDFDGDGCFDHLDSEVDNPNVTHLTNCSIDIPMISNKGLMILIIIMSLLSFLNMQYSNFKNIH